MCDVLLPPGVNPTAVKYIYHIMSSDIQLQLLLMMMMIIIIIIIIWAGSSVGIATGYGLDGFRGSNPGGGEIFRTRPERHGGPSRLPYNGYRVFPGGKAAGAWC
jgi:hypothetical protein